jgi:hypothetical protein
VAIICDGLGKEGVELDAPFVRTLDVRKVDIEVQADGSIVARLPRQEPVDEPSGSVMVGEGVNRRPNFDPLSASKKLDADSQQCSPE